MPERVGHVDKQRFLLHLETEVFPQKRLVIDEEEFLELFDRSIGIEPP